MTEKKIKNNMSSSGLTRRSRNKDLHADWIPDQVGDDRKGRKDDGKGETGRSMVEMLGVLAVVGVLSVGGIAGYTYAMNKYYANELLAGASERAVLLTAQIVAGREPNLNEFAHHTTAGGTFATDDERVRVYTDGIGIPVSDVKEAVCENLIKATEGTNILITDIDENEISADDCAEESNDLLFVFETGIGGTGEETDPACADVECPVAGTACVNGSCLCPDGMLPCKGACCGEGEICTAPGSGTKGECFTPTGECVTNADCGKDEFCLFESSTTATNAGTKCHVPANGVCTPLTGDYAPQVVENTEEPLYGVTYSDAKMNWWSASNWCQANKTSLMTFATLNTLSGEKSKDARKKALEGGLGKTGFHYLWLEDAYSSTSCNALLVHLMYGSVDDTFYRTANSCYALCR